MPREQRKQAFGLTTDPESPYCRFQEEEASSTSKTSPWKVNFELPENVEMGGKIKEINLCYASAPKRILRYLFYVLTLWFGYLLCLWIVSLRIKMTYTLCSPRECNHVIVHGADGSTEIVKITWESTTNSKFMCFKYRLFKYYYERNQESFIPAQFELDRFTFQQLKTEFSQGLTQQAVLDNQRFYEKNLTEVPRQPWYILLVKEVLSPFYIFQVFSFVVWILDAYVSYSIIVFILSGIAIIQSMVETMSIRNKLYKMSYYVTPITVFRRNATGATVSEQISSEDLVPGDLIQVPENIMIPCDAIMINGGCIMNESMLTGESVPVFKSAVPDMNKKYNGNDDKQHTLYSGTMCMQARGSKGKPPLAIVTFTGFATIKGDLIRTMLFPKESDFEFYADSFKFIGFLAFMAVLGTGIDFYAWAQESLSGMGYILFVKASQIITITVPPALPTCVQVGISVALARLQKKQIFCISPSTINETGRINMMCFDKTGTLTEDGLDILGARPVYIDKKKKFTFSKLQTDFSTLAPEISTNTRQLENKRYDKMFNNTSTGLPSEQLFDALMCCHSLTKVNGNLIGDTLDIKMFNATGAILDESESTDNGAHIIASITTPKFSNRTIGIVRKFEFASKLQRMSVVTKVIGDPIYRMFIKGSPEKIREMCNEKTIPGNFHKILQKYTENGYRVLALGAKLLDIEYKQLMSSERAELESGFNFLGLFIVENKLKPITTEIINKLHNADVKTIMVTGDNILTAISVARQCQMVKSHQRVYLGEVAEKKVNGKDRIIWRDFENYPDMLNDELEPELEYGHSSPNLAAQQGLSPFRRQSSTGGPNDDLDNFKLDGEEGQVKYDKALLDEVREFDDEDLKGSMGVLDIEPPFLDHLENEDYVIAVTGRTYGKIIEEAEENNSQRYRQILNKMLKKCVIYARMQPDQKASMITYLRKDQKHNVVGMCGDGANDCGALKAANVGISLSEAEASIAAPFTSKIQDISCVVELLKEGKAALTTSFQCFKYMALYSIIQFCGVTILYYQFIDYTNWHYYHQDLLAVLPFSLVMALSPTADNLTNHRPVGRLVSVNVLGSVIGQSFIQIAFQLGIYLILLDQEYPGCPDNWTTKDPCYRNSTLYLMAVYQLCFVALAYTSGKPFRKNFYRNTYFLVYLILYLAFNLLLTFNPLHFQFIYNPKWGILYDMDMSWVIIILIFCFVDLLFIMTWEYAIVPCMTRMHRRRLTQKLLRRMTTKEKFELQRRLTSTLQENHPKQQSEQEDKTSSGNFTAIMDKEPQKRDLRENLLEFRTD